MKTKIKFDFNQLYISIVSFASDLEKKCQSIIDEIPVFINYMGDSNYMMNTKFGEISNKEVYNCIPRIVVSIQGDTTVNQESNTQHGNIIEYKLNNEILKSSMRRSEIGVNLKIAFITSNIVDCLQSFVILMSIFNRPNAFTYSFINLNMEASYSFDNNVAITIPQSDSTNKNYICELNITLKSQLFIPRLETIVDYKDKIAETVNLEIS